MFSTIHIRIQSNLYSVLFERIKKAHQIDGLFLK